MRIIGFLATIALALWPRAATASEVGLPLPSAAGKNAITLRTGFDDALVVTGLGYTRGLPLPRIGRSLMIGGELAIPMTRPDFGDFRLRVGARMNAVQVKGFELPLSTGPSIVRTHNELFTGVGIGTFLATYPGYYRARWFAAGELRWDHTWAAHLHHGAIYRKQIYPGARDGWYGATAWSLRAGLRGGGLPHERVELMLRIGYELVPGLSAIIPPLYADLTVGVRF